MYCHEFNIKYAKQLSRVLFLTMLFITTSIALVKAIDVIRKQTSNILLNKTNELNEILFSVRSIVKEILSEKYNGCDNETLTKIRKQVAQTPSIRTINFAIDSVLVCSSVLGPVSYEILPTYRTNKKLYLMNGNYLTPGKPLMVYKEDINDKLAVFVGLESSFFTSQLSNNKYNIPIFLEIDDKILSSDGEILQSKFNYSAIVKVHAAHFNLLSNLNYVYLAKVFWPLLIFACFLSLMLSIVLTYLAYICMLKYIQWNNPATPNIEKGEILPVIQPIVDPMTNNIVGGEILARWMHPKHGFISPDIFIPEAERNSTINDITLSLFRKVTEKVQKLPPLDSNGFFLSFNISASFFHDSKMLPATIDFCTFLSKYNINLVLEITERQLFEESQLITDAVVNLRKYGVKFALDDFGVGNANLDYIRIFNPDYLKIDKAFTKGILDDEKSLMLIRCIAIIAKDLHIITIAEGIESEMQKLVLDEELIDLHQGYLYSPAIDMDDFFKKI